MGKLKNVDTLIGYHKKPKNIKGYKIELQYCECGCKKSFYRYVKIEKINTNFNQYLFDVIGRITNHCCLQSEIDEIQNAVINQLKTKKPNIKELGEIGKVKYLLTDSEIKQFYELSIKHFLK